MARAAVRTPSERAPSEHRSRLIIIAAVIFAGIAALLLFVALQNGDGGGGGSEGAAAATTEVVVATRSISANTTLEADMIEVKAIPLDQSLTGAYSTLDAALGLPVRYPLQAGEQVTTLKIGLDAIEDEKDLALVLEPGERAFAVEATEVSAVGGLLLPGNFIDVIAVFDEETFGVGKTETVLQNIEVLSVAQEAQEPVPRASTDDPADLAGGSGISGQRPEEVERQPRARSVTLAVTPQQAQLLAALQSEGTGIKIWLALRPLEDGAAQILLGTNLDRFYSPPR